MIVTVIFLLTCVITARILVRKNIRAAYAAYSVMFVIVLCLLAFAIENPIISRAMSNIVGAKSYNDIHSAICEAARTPVYGFSMIGGIATLFFVQLIASVIEMACVVAGCFKKESLVRKFKKAYVIFALHVRNLRLQKRINLLYCRLLN